TAHRRRRNTMIEHVEKQCEPAVRARARGRGGAGGGRARSGIAGGALRVGLAIGVSLACAAPAHAQSGEPPADGAAEPASATPADPALAGDETASASDAADADAPWNQG